MSWYFLCSRAHFIIYTILINIVHFTESNEIGLKDAERKLLTLNRGREEGGGRYKGREGGGDIYLRPSEILKRELQDFKKI